MDNARRARMLLRAALLEEGLTLAGFSRKHGFNIETVKKVIQRHWGKNSSPRGSITTAILTALENHYKCHQHHSHLHCVHMISSKDGKIKANAK